MLIICFRLHFRALSRAEKEKQVRCKLSTSG